MTPTVTTQHGQVWLEQDDQAIHMTADEIPVVAAALLAELDSLEDAL